MTHKERAEKFISSIGNDIDETEGRNFYVTRLEQAFKEVAEREREECKKYGLKNGLSFK